MKYRINFNIRYALPMLLFLWMALGTGSCVREDLIDGNESDKVSSVTIKVKLPEQTVQATQTRATGTDYDEVRNMNILISDKGIIKKRLYLDFAGKKWEDGTTIANRSQSNGVTIEYDDADGFRLFHLIFDEAFWTDGDPISLRSCQFYAVANWGSKITYDQDRNSVDNLRNLTAEVKTTTNNGTDYATVITPNVMYGEIISETTEPIPGNPSEVTRKVTIGLKRTAAMITLAMDGSGLDRGVVIDLTSVTLHNVPTSCTLGKSNAPATATNYIAKNGDFVGGPSLARGRLVGTATQTEMSGFTEELGFLTTIGGHYDMDANNNVSINKDAPVMPLFLYENVQGTGEPVTKENQTMKRPQGVAATESAIANYNQNGVCSYIEIIGTYTQYATDMSITQKGPVTWRFFLGGNETDDFNVERNKNYRLTLVLTDTGIGEANSSWRVDADLEMPTVVGDTEMVVGGGGEMFCVELNGNLSQVITNGLKLSGPTANFVYVYTKPNSYYQWTQVSTVSGNTHFDEGTLDNKQLWFYVQPLLPDDTSYSGNERTASVEFQNNKNITQATVTFTQYRPVTFSITANDLVAYGTDPDLQEAKRLIETYYKHDFTDGSEFKFYADRVDRGPLQWGFSGVQLDKNQNTGFENVYHLIDPLPENRNPEVCPQHIEYAKNYLPTGRGWKENTHINYDNGSCMMHAAMENYFQQYYPKPANDVSPAVLYNTGLPSRPENDNNTPAARRYSWCVPSIVGWKLVEILDRFYKNHGITDRGFDPKYPVLKWVSYWTSNAATADLASIYPSLSIDGKNRSFVYQFGTGLDKIGTNDTYPGYLLMNRNAKVRYRLLNIKPDTVSGTTTK